MSISPWWKGALSLTFLLLTACTLPLAAPPATALPFPAPSVALTATIALPSPESVPLPTATVVSPSPSPVVVAPTQTLPPVPTAFCADPRVQSLLDSLGQALLAGDGERLAALISPTRGLDLRYWRYGTVASYSREEARWVFQSTYEVRWGAEPGSGRETVGTFRDVPLPALLEVFTAAHERYCNDPGITALFSPQPWPEEYHGLNYYTLYKPGSEQYGGLDWRAWLVGVEYVQDAPYVFALIHFQWEP